MRHSIRDHSLRAVAVIAVLFGLLTIASAGSVLFGSDAVRQTAGATVGFVVWFNFVAGFAYVVAGLGLWLRRRWAVPWAGLIAMATATVFVAFAVHVWGGGAHELRTVAAMTVRLALWAGIAWVGYRRLWRSA
jgi:hypothetical protein